MDGSLLESKFHVPRVRRQLVRRRRLVEQLERGTQSKLTLISAPPGSGKTTLLTDWVATAPDRETSAAWVSLDADDTRLSTFWTYVTAAIARVAPGAGTSAQALLLDGQSASPETVAAALLNDLRTISNPLRIVLDDYHMIDAPEIHSSMAFFLERLPAHTNVVIATRADPPLPLARLRAQGELVEIRAADLRFDETETGTFLNEMMGLSLTAQQMAQLDERTEGWAAALQLAALSMEGRTDIPAFIAGFTGSERYVVDYLVEEVLDRQPDHVRRFLTETSILDRLTGDLCDAVTDTDGGRAMLEMLERSNLLIVPLDDHRRWYRYHHLFADVLRARLLDEHPERILELHRRASQWYEDHESRSEAIRHAIAALDFERAADLVELAIPAFRQARQEADLRSWLEALPADVFAVRPVLSVGYVGTLMACGELKGVERHLRNAEQMLEARESGASPSMVVANHAELRRLPGAIALYRAAQARILGDEAGSMDHARRALELAAPEDHLERGGAAGLLALAHWTAGDLEAAYDRWAEAMANLEMADHASDVIGCAISLADICITQGRLRDALAIYRRGLNLSIGVNGIVRRGGADMHVGIAGILTEQNDLAGAREHLVASMRLGEANGLPQNRHRSLVAEARILWAERDIDHALGLLTEAEQVYFGDFSPEVRPIRALRAKLWLAAGRTSDAVDWARTRGLSTRDDLRYVHEFEHITFARVLLAEAIGDREERALRDLLAFTERLLASADTGGRTGSGIEILVIQSLVHEAAGDTAAARTSLEGALVLAEPEGYVRIFDDGGRPLEALLGLTANSGGASSGYARRLLEAFGDGARVRPTVGGLVDPLTERELQVLRLLAGDLTGPEIARELFVSLNTMRTHTKSIYGKLGVTSRRAAVRRATELTLIP